MHQVTHESAIIFVYRVNIILDILSLVSEKTQIGPFVFPWYYALKGEYLISYDLSFLLTTKKV